MTSYLTCVGNQWEGVVNNCSSHGQQPITCVHSLLPSACKGYRLLGGITCGCHLANTVERSMLGGNAGCRCHYCINLSVVVLYFDRCIVYRRLIDLLYTTISMTRVTPAYGYLPRQRSLTLALASTPYPRIPPRILA